MITTLTLPQVYGDTTDAQMAGFEDRCFADWLKKINKHLSETYGLDIGDLPDIAMREIYDNGGSALDGVRALLEIDW